MKFLFRNTSVAILSVFVEPSTDELTLRAGDTLAIIPHFDKSDTFEFDLKDSELTIWLPHGQSADIYINEQEVDSYASKYVW